MSDPTLAYRAAHEAASRRLGASLTDARFVVRGWDVDGDTVHVHHEVVGLAPLTESVRFPGHDLAARLHDAHGTALRGLFDLLAVVSMTSVYKTTLAPRIELGAASPALVRVADALVREGLKEFAVDNGLPPGGLATWPQIVATATPDAVGHGAPTPPDAVPDDATATADATIDGVVGGAVDGATDSATTNTTGDVVARDDPDPRRRVLVPVGGGKDSAVTAWLAIAAGMDVATVAVNPRDSMYRTAAAAERELIEVERRLDPALFAHNDAGSLNGHVPITAIVATITAIAAFLDGRGRVWLSNEASADEPTRTIDGVPVNHQYSKSSAFESLLLDALDDATDGRVQVSSVLRPLPELLVAACFAALQIPLTAVNSCNRAYALRAARREWCGRCPKCLFVQVMLAPFLAPEDFRDGTGFDALADPELLDDLRDLTDPERKPFECVGTVDEVQLAFDLLADDPRWRDHVAVRALGRAGRDASSRLQTMVDAVPANVVDSALDPTIRATLDRAMTSITLVTTSAPGTPNAPDAPSASDPPNAPSSSTTPRDPRGTP